MRSTLFILAAGVCLGSLGLDPDKATVTPAEAKPIAYEPAPMERPISTLPPAVIAETCPCPDGCDCTYVNGKCTCRTAKILPAAAPAPIVKPAVMTKAAAPRGYICGPSGCYPAAAATRYAGGGERRGMFGRWYPGKRVVGFLRGRRR